MNITNRDGQVASIQVGHVQNIPSKKFESPTAFLIKNISVSRTSVPRYVSARILPCGQTDWIDTLLFPGWNPELVNGVELTDDGELQYGW